MAVSPTDEANRQWAHMLARWAIPEELLQAAPSSPYYFDPRVFIAGGGRDARPARGFAFRTQPRESLPPGGTVLDVGVGAGAASLRLAAGAGHIFGVDLHRELLDAFAARAEGVGVGCTNGCSRRHRLTTCAR